MKQQIITDLLKKEVVPALGCTAPVAVALAAARSAAELEGKIDTIRVSLSLGIYKNGWGVAVPGTSERGNALGAALGAVGGDYRLGLQVLTTATEADMKQARALLDANRVEISCDTSKEGVYIDAVVQSADASRVRTVISGSHSDIVLVQKNGDTIFETSKEPNGNTNFEHVPTLQEALDYIESVPAEDIRFLLDGIRMNLDLAQDGLDHPFGLCSGRILKDSMEPGDWERPVARARVLTCAASDARMGGSLLPAMSTVGSGNQGITAILPVAVFAEHSQVGDERTSRALALSHLVTYLVKSRVGRISSTCLCAIASASGAAAAITWLSNGNREMIAGSVKNVVSPLAGMICDGAKGACALKMGAASTEAFHAANLALHGSAAGYYDGLATESMVSTLDNLSKLTTHTQKDVDIAIMEMLTEKETRQAE